MLHFHNQYNRFITKKNKFLFFYKNIKYNKFKQKMNASNKFKKKLVALIEKLTFWICSIISCLPLVAGILIPMVVMIPLAYISWYLFSFWKGGYWMDIWISVSPYHPIRFLLVITIEISIFIGGSLLFLTGLYHLVKGKKSEQNIVQTGSYKLIRHPQNLGILLMALSFALYIPGLNDLGIRIGEILSWTLFGLILIIYSYIEEYKLSKKFPEEFSNYQANTGFFFPKLNFRKSKKDKPICYHKKFLFLLLGYVLLVFTIFILINFLMTLGIFTIYL